MAASPAADNDKMLLRPLRLPVLALALALFPACSSGPHHRAARGAVVRVTERDFRIKALGCDLAQGFLFARPLPAGQIQELVAGGFSDLIEPRAPSLSMLA